MSCRTSIERLCVQTSNPCHAHRQQVGHGCGGHQQRLRRGEIPVVAEASHTSVDERNPMPVTHRQQMMVAVQAARKRVSAAAAKSIRSAREVCQRARPKRHPSRVRRRGRRGPVTEYCRGVRLHCRDSGSPERKWGTYIGFTGV